MNEVPRNVVAGAVACAAIAAAAVRATGWPTWAALVTFVVLTVVFLSTEAMPPRR